MNHKEALAAMKTGARVKVPGKEGYYYHSKVYCIELCTNRNHYHRELGGKKFPDEIAETIVYVTDRSFSPIQGGIEEYMKRFEHWEILEDK